MISLERASAMTIVVNCSILNSSPSIQINNLKHEPFSYVPKLSQHETPTSGFSSSPPLFSGYFSSMSCIVRCTICFSYFLGKSVVIEAEIVLPVKNIKERPEIINRIQRWNFIGIGPCKASQVAELFPTVSPEIVVREARIEDCWEVAETHCSSFFPQYSFPLDFVLRIDRLIGMLFGFSIPKGCKRTCLVAVTGTCEDSFVLGSDDFKIGGLDGKFSLNKGYVAGVFTVDTVANSLPRRGPLRQRRTGINIYQMLLSGKDFVGRE